MANGERRSLLGLLRGNLGVVLLTGAISRFGDMLCEPAFPRYAELLGASAPEIGLINGAGVAAYLFSQIPGGYVADRYGRKRVIAVMSFVLALGYIPMVLAPSWEWLLLGVVIQNAALVYAPAIRALVADTIPPELRGRGYVLSQVVTSAASMAALPIATYVIYRAGVLRGVRLGYAACLVLMIVSATLRAALLRETYTPRPFQRATAGGEMLDALRELVARLRWFVLAAFLLSLSPALTKGYYILYAVHVAGLEDWQWLITYIVALAFYFTLSYPMGRFIDRVGRRRAVASSLALFLPGMALFLASRGFTECAAAVTLITLGNAIRQPAIRALEADLIPRSKRGRMMAIMNIVESTPMVFGPPLGGFLYTLLPQLPFAASAAVLCAGVAVLGLCVEEPSGARAQ